MREDGTISKRGYMMAHYSKFVRPGYVRVDATPNPDQDVWVSAYTGDGEAVIVAVNKGTSAARGNVVLQNGDIATITSWVTDENRDLALGEPITVTEDSFRASLPARSVTTFVVKLAQPQPQPEPDPETYSLTIEAGQGGSISAGTSGEYEAGTEISISASSNQHYQFKEWTSSNGGTFADAKSTTTTFTMPGADTTITAHFEYAYSGGGYIPVTPVTPEPSTSVTDGISKTTVQASYLEEAFDASNTAVIELPEAEGVTAYTVTVPASSLGGDDATKMIEIVSELATLKLPSNMLTPDDVSGAQQVTLSIARADTSTLDQDVLDRIGDRPVIELDVYVDGNKIEWNNPEAPLTITIPYTPTAEELADPEHIVVWYIDGTGAAVAVPSGRYDPATGTVTFTTTHLSQYAVAYVKKSFEDIAAYPWAIRAIEVMASKGVIGDGAHQDDSLFDPTAHITRGEFILQLIRALGLNAEVKDNFSDVPADASYAEAVAIAKKLGITNGVGHDKFDPTAPITRQDMMTLIVRAMEVAQQYLTGGSSADLERFADKGEVAAYAIQSMATLVKHGIVKGDGVRLNPTAYTSRAEAAVLMYRLYHY